uniref:Uncharacterized protein n=1 Tax=Branchiostoma floridae TaxID=7739 RepID=C3ZMZ7_BRAFL|eukprot:XP_002590126.1 hypothetical protein BRAFLDRAFT_83406 [Branchiostoma floridae]
MEIRPAGLGSVVSIKAVFSGRGLMRHHSKTSSNMARPRDPKTFTRHVGPVMCPWVPGVAVELPYRMWRDVLHSFKNEGCHDQVQDKIGEETAFTEWTDKAGYKVYESILYGHSGPEARKFCVALNKNGKPRNGRRTKRSRASAQFVPRNMGEGEQPRLPANRAMRLVRLRKKQRKNRRRNRRKQKRPSKQ